MNRVGNPIEVDPTLILVLDSTVDTTAGPDHAPVIDHTQDIDLYQMPVRDLDLVVVVVANLTVAQYLSLPRLRWLTNDASVRVGRVGVMGYPHD